MNDYTITMTRGDTYKLKVSLKENGIPVPFDPSDTVYFTVRKDEKSEIDIQKVITSFTDDGAAVISLDPEDTASLPYESKNRKYDIEVRKANGEIYTLVKYSTFILGKEITLNEP